MKALLSMFGDGSGSLSMMRLVTLLVILTVLIPKAVISIRTGVAPVFTPADMEIIGLALGAKLLQNMQENKSDSKPPDKQPNQIP